MNPGKQVNMAGSAYYYINSYLPIMVYYTWEHVNNRSNKIDTEKTDTYSYDLVYRLL